LFEGAETAIFLASILEIGVLKHHKSFCITNRSRKASMGDIAYLVLAVTSLFCFLSKECPLGLPRGVQGQILQSDESNFTVSAVMRVAYDEVVPNEDIARLECKLKAVSSYFNIHVAGIDLQAFPTACGKCIEIKCINDQECIGSSSESVVAVVADDCFGCGQAQLQVNEFTARQLVGKVEDETNVKWGFISCSTYGTVIKDDDIKNTSEPSVEPASEPSPEQDLLEEAIPAPDREVVGAPSSEPSSEPSPELDLLEEAIPAPDREVVRAPASEPSPEQDLLEEAIPAPDREVVGAPASEPSSEPSPTSETVVDPTLKIVPDQLETGTQANTSATAPVVNPIALKPGRNDSAFPQDPILQVANPIHPSVENELVESGVAMESWFKDNLEEMSCSLGAMTPFGRVRALLPLPNVLEFNVPNFDQ